MLLKIHEWDSYFSINKNRMFNLLLFRQYDMTLWKPWNCLSLNSNPNRVARLAAWGPGFHGPNGEWEQSWKETGLCLFVCNRTGNDDTLTLDGSFSAGVVDGLRKVEYAYKQMAILSMDVRSGNWTPAVGHLRKTNLIWLWRSNPLDRHSKIKFAP